MRRIAIINQKGGVGKTTTTVNLGAALAIQGRRVVLVDMDAQANLSMALGIEAASGTPTSYSVLMGDHPFAACIRATKIPRLSIVPSNIDLSGAELELASAMGREYLLRDALTEWNDAHVKRHGIPACDYVLFDCPPSLGLLSINALAAASEVLITLQTEFLALQGMSKLLEIITLLKKRLNPDLTVTGIVPSLYDSRLKLAREVLGEIRSYFKDQVVPHPIRANVKLAEAPSFGQTIFEYAPDSNGADDYMKLAYELVSRESRDKSLAGLPAFAAGARLPVELTNEPIPHKRVPPPPPKRKVVATSDAQPAARTEAVKPPSAPSVELAARGLVGRSGTQARAAVEPAVEKRSYSAVPPKAPDRKRGEGPRADDRGREPRIEEDRLPPGKHGESKPERASKSPAESSGTSRRSELPAAHKPEALKPVELPRQAPVSRPAEKSAQPTPISSPPAKSKKGRETESTPVQEPAATPKSTRPRIQPHAKANGKHPSTEQRKDPSIEKPATRHATGTRTNDKSSHHAHADDIPALPPDAFEILSTPLDP